MTIFGKDKKMAPLEHPQDYAIAQLEQELVQLAQQATELSASIRVQELALQREIRAHAAELLDDVLAGRKSLPSIVGPDFITPAVETAVAAWLAGDRPFTVRVQLQTRLAAHLSGGLLVQMRAAPLRQQKEQVASLEREAHSLRIALAGLRKQKNLPQGVPVMVTADEIG